MTTWIDVCAPDEIDREDVMRFDHGPATYAIYHAPDGSFHATDGLCTHERVHLADGLVMDDTIECPKHNGRFNYRTGAPLRAPVCVALRRHSVRVAGGRVQLGLEE
jgi:3-phenylpropionate/trans-cinnamate dioxygenase ferredoxin subunit